MSFLVPKEAPASPFGVGFKYNAVTKAYDVDGAAATAATGNPPAAGTVLSGDATTAYSLTEMAATMAPILAPLIASINGSSSSGSTTPTPTPTPTASPAPAYTFSVFQDNWGGAPGFDFQFNVFEPNGTRITPSALPTSNWTVSFGWSNSTPVAPKAGDPLFYATTWSSYQNGQWDAAAAGYPFGNAGAVTGDVYYPWAVTSDGAAFCFTGNSHPAP